MVLFPGLQLMFKYGAKEARQIIKQHGGSGKLFRMSQKEFARIGDKKPGKMRDDKSHEEIVQVLNSETQKIKKVKDDMLSSIQYGKDLMVELGVGN